MSTSACFVILLLVSLTSGWLPARFPHRVVMRDVRMKGFGERVDVEKVEAVRKLVHEFKHAYEMK